MVYLNYDVDRQRKMARDAKAKDPNGTCMIWGEPAKMMEVMYRTGADNATVHRTFLLYSGWWGMARHINYLFELLLALSWGMASGELYAFAPYFYVFFLTILLVHRAIRDDGRCQAKYGDGWTEYKKVAKYSIIPGIY